MNRTSSCYWISISRLFQYAMCFMSLMVLTSIAKHDGKLFIFFPSPSETQTSSYQEDHEDRAEPSNLILSEKSPQPKGGFLGILVQFFFIYPSG